MKSEIFIEGNNGGRSRKRDLNAPWYGLHFDGDQPMLPVTLATEYGAVIVTFSDDGKNVSIALKPWKISEKSPKAGVNKQLYDGPLNA